MRYNINSPSRTLYALDPDSPSPLLNKNFNYSGSGAHMVIKQQWKKEHKPGNEPVHRKNFHFIDETRN